MVSEATIVSAETSDSSESRMRAALDAILPFARAADALARRTVTKVRTTALLGILSALGITAACVYTFEWGLAAAITLVAFLILPGAVLWKLHGVLRSSVGLPQRIVDTAVGAYDRTNELRAHYLDRSVEPPAEEKKSRFRDLWKATRKIREIKHLSDEARELVAIAGKSIAVANPAFAIALLIASALSLLITLIAALVGLAFVF